MKMNENFEREIEVIKKIMLDYWRLSLKKIAEDLKIKNDKFLLDEDVIDVIRISGLKNKIEFFAGAEGSYRGKDVTEIFIKIEYDGNVSMCFRFLNNEECSLSEFIRRLSFKEVSAEGVAVVVDDIKKCIDKMLEIIKEGIQKIIEMRKRTMDEVKATSLYEKIASERIKERFEEGGER